MDAKGGDDTITMDLGQYVPQQGLILNGGTGNDEIDIRSYEGSNSILHGGPGNDNLSGGKADDVIYGGDGADTIFGHGGNDKLFGGSTPATGIAFGPAITGPDLLVGGDGNDTIHGSQLNDTLQGGTGVDKLYGHGGDDVLYDNSPAGADSDASDELWGGSGNDQMFGKQAELVVGESGTTSVYQPNTSTWHTIWLSRTYVNPVVIMGPLSYNGGDPAVVRVRNVQGDRFEFQVDEWNYKDGGHTTETVSWMVVEAGEHVLEDGTRLVAGTVNTDHNFKTVLFDTPFAGTPIVLTQTMTRNGSDAVTTRQRVSQARFDVRVQEEESLGSHATETVGWIAIEWTSGRNDGKPYVVGRTGNQVTENWHQIRWSSDSPSSPVLLANMQTYDGGDPAALRYQQLTTTGVQVFVEEETSYDSEASHTTEVVGYLLLGAGDIRASQSTGTLHNRVDHIDDAFLDGFGVEEDVFVHYTNTERVVITEHVSKWVAADETVYVLNESGSLFRGQQRLHTQVVDFAAPGDGTVYALTRDGSDPNLTPDQLVRFSADGQSVIASDLYQAQVVGNQAYALSVTGEFFRNGQRIEGTVQTFVAQLHQPVYYLTFDGYLRRISPQQSSPEKLITQERFQKIDVSRNGTWYALDQWARLWKNGRPVWWITDDFAVRPDTDLYYLGTSGWFGRLRVSDGKWTTLGGNIHDFSMELDGTTWTLDAHTNVYRNLNEGGGWVTNNIKDLNQDADGRVYFLSWAGDLRRQLSVGSTYWQWPLSYDVAKFRLDRQSNVYTLHRDWHLRVNKQPRWTHTADFDIHRDGTLYWLSDYGLLQKRVGSTWVDLDKNHQVWKFGFYADSGVWALRSDHWIYSYGRNWTSADGLHRSWSGVADFTVGRGGIIHSVGTDGRYMWRIKPVDTNNPFVAYKWESLGYGNWTGYRWRLPWESMGRTGWTIEDAGSWGLWDEYFYRNSYLF